MNEPIPGDSNPPENPASPDFKTFALADGIRKENIDIDNQFTCKVFEGSVRRAYYASNPNGGFETTARLVDWGEMGGIHLAKIGRRGEVEAVTLGKYVSDYRLQNIKGQKEFGGSVSNINVHFSDDGSFDIISVSQSPEILKSLPTRHELLVRHFQRTSEPFVRRNKYACIIAEDNGDSYIFYIAESDGTPQYKAVIQKKRDKAEDILQDLGVDNIVKNPTQPVHGVEGESHGDDLWRYANFPDKMGVHVTPIDTPEELSEFEAKGFGKLVADIAKKV